MKTSELKPGMRVEIIYASGLQLIIESNGPEEDPANNYTYAVHFQGESAPWRFIPDGNGDDDIWIEVLRRASELKPGDVVETKIGPRQVQRIIFIGRGWFGVEFAHCFDMLVLFKTGGTNDDARWKVCQ